MSKVNSRKGFTIAELVVAMAIIFIVSATAIGIINTQNTVHLRTTQTVEATNMAENAIECFRYAVENPKDNDTGKDDVVATFAKAYAKTFTDKTRPTDLYNFEKSNMNVTITIEGNKLTFKAIAKDNDKVILEESYTK